jgi:UV excision repair protein RAD23
MGFPEAEARAALRAAMGNPDVAVEFLFNGIPEHALRAASGGAPAGGASAGAGAGGAAGGAGMLEQLRHHPHINALRRMVQQNPASLQTILQQIGAQNPELLAVIHQNQQAFLEIMNEPIGEDPSPEELMENMSPQQFVELLQHTPPQQQAALAESMGMTLEQFQGITQMISSMPPEQLQNMMAMFRGMGGAGGMGGGAGAAPPGTVRLTEDEMAAVRRLMELGFDQSEAVQVFLACDKNEALAANVLMDGWNGGAGGAGGNFGGDFGGDYEGGDGDNDDMYS